MAPKMGLKNPLFVFFPFQVFSTWEKNSTELDQTLSKLKTSLGKFSYSNSKLFPYKSAKINLNPVWSTNWLKIPTCGRKLSGFLTVLLAIYHLGVML